MDRAIVGFQTDDAGEWVALLECRHRQHVRHQPPFQNRPWTLTALGRARRIGTRLTCVLCDEELAETQTQDAGGSPVCLADEVCPECGGLDSHRAGCSRS